MLERLKEMLRRGPVVQSEPFSFPEGLDPEREGSRFTSRVAFAVSAMETHGDRREADGHGKSPVTQEAIEAHLGLNALDADPEGGQPKAVDGSVGRGAAGWIPVVEWAAAVAIGGVISGAAWDGVKAAGRRAKALLTRATEGGEKVFVSRGLAAVFAADHVLAETGEAGILDTESVVEPSTLRGEDPSELSYVGSEPWLVSLINESRTTRYLVAVSPDGNIEGMIPLPLSEFERLFPPLPPRV
jgi:hypothetical protein